jgi:hypothetical protein
MRTSFKWGVPLLLALSGHGHAQTSPPDLKKFMPNALSRQELKRCMEQEDELAMRKETLARSQAESDRKPAEHDSTIAALKEDGADFLARCGSRPYLTSDRDELRNERRRAAASNPGEATHAPRPSIFWP